MEQEETDNVHHQAYHTDDQHQLRLVQRLGIDKAFERLDKNRKAQGEKKDCVNESSEYLGTGPAESVLRPLLRGHLCV